MSNIEPRLMGYNPNYFPANGDVLTMGGDVSGTKCLFKISALRGSESVPVARAKYNSAEIRNFPDIVADFLKRANIKPGEIERAVFAPAGPIVNKRQCRLTNGAKYTVDADEVEGNVGIRDAALVNDFRAIAYGIASSGEELELVAIPHLDGSFGESINGAVHTLVGKGTGTGRSRWRYDIINPQRFDVWDSEGSHMYLSAISRDSEDMALVDSFSSVEGGVIIDPYSEAFLSSPGVVSGAEFFINRMPADRIRALGLEGKIDEFRALRTNDEKELFIAKEGNPTLTLDGPPENPFGKDMYYLWTHYGKLLHDAAANDNSWGGLWIAGGTIRDVYVPGAENQVHPVISRLLMRPIDYSPSHRGLMRKLPVKAVLDQEVGVNGALAISGRPEYFALEKPGYKIAA